MSEIINEVKVLWVSKSIYPSGAYLKEHHHEDYYQIYYVTENRAEFLVNGNPFVLSENMMVFARPGVVHGIKPISGPDPMRMLEVKFTVLENDLVEEFNNVPLVFYGNDLLQRILSIVVDEGLKKDLFFEKSITHQFCSFLYKMIQHYKNFNQGSPGKINKINPAAKIKEYIKENYRQEISLADIASNVGYTKNYLCRLFRENANITINDYLNNVRIHHAVDLLLTTDMDISEISKASGYTNIYHFIKTFKKLTKISPGSYRRRSIIGEELASGKVDSKYSVIWEPSE